MSNANTFELLARLVFSLGIVLGLMWFLARVMKKKGLSLGPNARRAQMSGADVELLARKSLGRNMSIAIVRAGGRSMVVGITEHQITKLEDADIEEIDLDESVTRVPVSTGSNGLGGQRTAGGKELMSSGQAWKTMLDHVRERTVRR